MASHANERLPDGEVPLPRLTPHDLRRTFASVLDALGEDPGVVTDEMGHTDPDLALAVYRQSMRRDEGEKDRLRALVEGAEMPGLGTSAQSDPDDSTAAEQSTEAASRS